MLSGGLIQFWKADMTAESQTLHSSYQLPVYYRTSLLRFSAKQKPTLWLKHGSHQSCIYVRLNNEFAVGLDLRASIY